MNNLYKEVTLNNTRRANSHATTFSSIYLVQSDGVQTPIVLATDVPTAPGQIIVDLPRTLVPSNACK